MLCCLQVAKDNTPLIAGAAAGGAVGAILLSYLAYRYMRRARRRAIIESKARQNVKQLAKVRPMDNTYDDLEESVKKKVRTVFA